MGYTMQMFADRAGEEPDGPAEDVGYSKLHDAKMRAREWFATNELARRHIKLPRPQSFKVFNKQGGVELHQCLGDTSYRTAVTKWRDELNKASTSAADASR